MSLEQLLQEIRRRCLVLTYGRSGRITLWSPNTYVPLTIRQAIRSHSQALQRLIASSDVSVCVNSGLHRQEWDYRARRYSCSICERLLSEVS
jgi:hypothetical protein